MNSQNSDRRGGCDTVAEGINGYWHLYGNMASFPSGVADHQIDEPWSNTNYNVIDNYDGRSAEDYVFWYNQTFLNVSVLRADNCSPL